MHGVTTKASLHQWMWVPTEMETVGRWSLQIPHFLLLCLLALLLQVRKQSNSRWITRCKPLVQIQRTLLEASRVGILQNRRWSTLTAYTATSRTQVKRILFTSSSSMEMDGVLLKRFLHLVRRQQQVSTKATTVITRIRLVAFTRYVTRCVALVW